METNNSVSESIIEKAFKEINRLAEGGELMVARKRCEALFEIYPTHPRVLHGIGLLKFRTGDLEDGEKLIRSAIEMNPNFAGAYHNYGRILFNSLRLEEAEEQFRKALELDPDNTSIMETLTATLIHRQNYQEARYYCNRGLELNPKLAANYGHLGSLMMVAGRPYDAITYVKKALSLQKINVLHSSLLFLLNLVPTVSQSDIYQESMRWSKAYTSRLRRTIRNHFNTPNPRRKLRIGYVSGDFRQHPVGYHLRPVLAAHDRRMFDIFLYNAFPNCDPITEEFSGYVDCYRDISLKPNEKIDSLIREDGIDILVDLAGHTGFNRLMLFARKPAPVQISWLGYFNTTGMATMDYFISDAITSPAEDDPYFVEKIIRLPDIRFCYEPLSYAPDVAPPPLLRNGYVTFGSFNAIHKMIPDVMELWGRVLQAVPNSRLLIKSKSFRDEEIMNEFKNRFVALGIEHNRLELRPSSPHQEMLSEYGDMDISLDTFPYNGGATTCEAIWMGVPVVTLLGNTPIGRQTAAYLKQFGHTDWIASSPDEYVETAKSLASDVSQLKQVRTRLRSDMANSPLCDGRNFTRNLESIYRKVWEEWCADETKHTSPSSQSTRRFTADELSDIGFNYLKDKQVDQAEIVFNRVLRRNSRHSQALNGLGFVREATGDFRGALRCFKRALKLVKSADTHYNLGCFYLDQRQYQKAITSFSNVVEMQPDNVKAYLNLGIAHKLRGCSENACRAFEKALTHDPGNLLARRQLALVISGTGDVKAGIEYVQQNLAAKPDDLESLYVYLNLLSYVTDTHQSEIFYVSKRIGELIGVRSQITGGRAFVQDKQHLNVGFVSADFVHHPVGMLLVALFKSFDPAKLSLICYNNGLKSDFLTSWYRSTATAWRDINDLNDEDVADQIKADQIDILVDLSGFTDRHRLSVFALRPAPVQVSWLGYWHTTGLKSMDYIIADKDFIHEEDEQWFCEKVVRLPNSRFCFVPPEPYPDVVEAPLIANGFVSFGCFNNPVKVTDEAIQSWAEIMKAVPRSRLIFKYKSFMDKAIRDRFIMKFQMHGIGRRRIEFRSESNLYLMMAELGDVDISFDPFPFCGGMTSLHSLWMGVPLVTFAGSLPVSRQSQSFLNQLGLSDLVAKTIDEYKSKLIALALDTKRLVELRESLRQRMLESPLCDPQRYARSVESLLFALWKDKL